MQKKPVKQAILDISALLSQKRNLQRFSVSKKTLLSLVRSDEFIENLGTLLPVRERFKCSELLSACLPVLGSLSSEPDEGWLMYTYHYAAYLMYPETFCSLAQEHSDGALFFLAFLQAMFDIERCHLAFDPLTDFDFPTEGELSDSERQEEFSRFLSFWKSEFIYELMRLGRECTPFSTLEHIAGVHHVAMSVSRGMKKHGVQIDMGLISAAAAGHDLGKFGCRAGERVPYLHYYYTNQWFAVRHMSGIGHIAANHSTWDLELENLSVESLALIYADFRVKQSRGSDNREITEIFSLDDSFGVILNKLDNVDEAKRRRYRYVYSKLHDFEDFMRLHGVDTTLSGRAVTPPPQKDIALMTADETMSALTMLTVEHNLKMMHRLNHERRFGNILEAARSEKNWKRIRAYLSIFEEYFAYLSATQKIQTINFLYELLMHREGDIRRQAAGLIGNIIANFNSGYRKELPADVLSLPGEQTQFSLWVQYLDMIIYPDHKLTPQHKSFIGYTLKIVVDSLLAHCEKSDTRQYLETLLRYYNCPEILSLEAAFSLADTMLYLPLAICSEDELMMMCRFANHFLSKGSIALQTASLRFLKLLSESFEREALCCRKALELAVAFDCKSNVTLTFLQLKILQNLGFECSEQQAAIYGRDIVSDIFLDNLKTATAWILKAVNIELLLDQVEHGIRDHILHISAHFSNLIKVSERVVVRHSAGSALLKLAPLLAFDQRNEIAVELTKGLEVGEYEISKYIPEYLGELALYLRPAELDELIGNLGQLLSSSNDRIVSVALSTVGVLLECYPEYRLRFPEEESVFEARRQLLLGMLLDGLANYRNAVHQEALLVIGKALFASNRLSHEEKAKLFTLSFKKMLFFICENSMSELSFFYRAAALSHVYRFMALQRLDYGEFEFEKRDRIAFFPGTFDPFTLSHKGIVRAIRDLGFEVYLAIDEFSWSKKTQPHLIRRQIVSMSVADEFHVHLFPDDIPVNIATPADLKRLKNVFAGKELYIAVGSDVVANASSYKMTPGENSIHTMNHIIFSRSEGLGLEAKTPENLSMISGDIIPLSLPTHLEDISSTRIRENIDLNRDIANLIDPVVQEFIYHNSLYLREPQYKSTLRPQDILFDFVESPDEGVLNEICDCLNLDFIEPHELCREIMSAGDNLLLMRDLDCFKAPIAFIRYRITPTGDLFRQLSDHVQADFVRQHTTGHVLLINGVYGRRSDKGYDFYQLLTTEVLAYALALECSFAVCRPDPNKDKRLIEVIERQGFLASQGGSEQHPFYTVDMHAPLVVIQNLETTIKEPFSSNERVLSAIRTAHQRLQTAMTALYPGNLVLSLSSSIIHHRLVGKITELNEVPSHATKVRQLGRFMCVPFGKILRGRVVPNTVTKTLHTDKVYLPDLSKSSIEPFPYYTSLQSQMKMIRSFDRPVILVDDIMHDGDRWQTLAPLIKREDIEVKSVIVGLLSGRGRDLMESQKQAVDSVYFLPNLRRWFVESTLYPFIGGDTIKRDKLPVSGLLPSVNMILPYASSKMLSDCSRRAVLEFSQCCIKNSRDILLTLETEYRESFARNLTLSRLSEAVILPLCPDKGGCLSYDPNLAASVYLENDLEMLLRTKEQLV